MSCTLPPEILDLIVDCLHDKPATLETCCVVSKSWIPRARKHLFYNVEFRDSGRFSIKQWKEAFPDPSSSPAHHTRTLSIRAVPEVASVGGWLDGFHNVVRLRLECFGEEHHASLAPLYGLSPTLRSLTLVPTPIEVFEFIRSFPLLEDLALGILDSGTEADRWITPATSPKLTGTLHLRAAWEIRAAVRRLCALPGGVHFTKITLEFAIGDSESITDLVSMCSDNLEYLSVGRVGCLSPLGTFASATMICQYLTTAHGCRGTWDIFPRPLHGHKTQSPGASVGRD